MKKFCLGICVILLLCAFAPLCASAASDAHNPTYVPPHKQYSLTTLAKNGTPVGVQFSGYYFGDSGIAVVVEAYSSAQTKLDFWIGDEELSATQQQTKQKMLELFETVHNFINVVDSCANTQYDGSTLANGFTLPLSDVFRYNSAKQGEKLEISRETYEMLQIAKAMYADTNGAFNPAVYRLVDLWGFSSRIFANGNFGLPYDRPVSGESFAKNGYPLPEQKYIESFSDPKFTDFSDSAVTLLQQDGKYFVSKNVAPAKVDGVEYDQWLDLGGIAKGYVVDEIKSLLENAGFEGYYVDAGSSSSAHGNSVSGGANTLLMADSFNKDAWIMPTALLGFEVGKCSVSTSGQYVRKYVTNGVEYAHIIDGTTGAPAQTGVKAVLVSVPESEGLWAGKSDCLTTALTVMGRDKIVDFVNGYLKQHNITVVVQFEDFDGDKQILSNLNKEQITYKSEALEGLGWTLNKKDDGTFAYDATVKFGVTKNPLKTLAIVLACVVGAGAVGLVIFHFVKGKKRALQNVQYSRKDKPFKPADVGVYLLVALLIVILFAVFFGNGSTNWNTLQVVDLETGEQLFFYNAARNEYKFNEQNSNGWQMEVSRQGNEILVTFRREIEGEEHFNTMKITRGATPAVKMTDAVCGFHKDCVYNFGEVKASGGVIVCSPNRLRVTCE